MKFVLSGRVVVVFLVVVLLATLFNTCLVILVYSRVSDVGRADSSGFEFVVSREGASVQVLNTFTKDIISGFASMSIAINYAFSQGGTVFLKGTFDLTEDIVISNKWNAKLVGDNAIINANGHSIIIHGDDYTYSKYPLISGLTLNEGTLRIENTFGATITNMVFQNCLVGLEFANDNTWTEGTKIENCHFKNCQEGIAFRTPRGIAATGSYESTEISRCFFNQIDHSIAINVEKNAELSCSTLKNVRMWIGEYDNNTNQTGLRIAGSMSQTTLSNVIFESFSKTPNNIYGIDLIETTYDTPILDTDVTFLGEWTAKIHNPHNKWIPSIGSLISQKNTPIQIGTNNNYGKPLTIQYTPLKIINYKPKIEVTGTFKQNEKITLNIKLEYIDGTHTTLQKTYTTPTTTWLTDDDLLQLYPSQNIAQTLTIEATTNQNNTDINIKISGYGNAG